MKNNKTKQNFSKQEIKLKIIFKVWIQILMNSKYKQDKKQLQKTLYPYWLQQIFLKIMFSYRSKKYLEYLNYFNHCSKLQIKQKMIMNFIDFYWTN